MSKQDPSLRLRANNDKSARPPARRFLPFILVTIMILIIGAKASSANSAIGIVSARAADEFVAYTPAIFSLYDATIPSLSGISGHVTSNGVGADGVELTLYRYNGNQWSPIMETSANENGFYRFEDVKSLGSDQEYYVRYGPNVDDPRYVYSWYGPIVDRYVEGDIITGGSFDIADIPLKKPVSGAKVSVPVNFEWEKRDFAVEDYRVVLLDLDSGDSWDSIFRSDSSKLTIFVLAPDIEYNKQYSWYVEVFSEVDSFGESFMLNDIEFKENSASRATANAMSSLNDRDQDARSGR